MEENEFYRPDEGNSVFSEEPAKPARSKNDLITKIFAFVFMGLTALLTVAVWVMYSQFDPAMQGMYPMAGIGAVNIVQACINMFSSAASMFPSGSPELIISGIYLILLGITAVVVGIATLILTIVSIVNVVRKKYIDVSKNFVYALMFVCVSYLMMTSFAQGTIMGIFVTVVAALGVVAIYTKIILNMVFNLPTIAGAYSLKEIVAMGIRSLAAFVFIIICINMYLGGPIATYLYNVMQGGGLGAPGMVFLITMVMVFVGALDMFILSLREAKTGFIVLMNLGDVGLPTDKKKRKAWNTFLVYTMVLSAFMLVGTVVELFYPGTDFGFLAPSICAVVFALVALISDVVVRGKLRDDKIKLKSDDPSSSDFSVF